MEKKIKLYLVPHSHIDMEWFWTVGDLVQMLPDLFYNSAFRMLETDSKMTFAQDQICLMNMALTNAPEKQ